MNSTRPYCSARSTKVKEKQVISSLLTEIFEQHSGNDDRLDADDDLQSIGSGEIFHAMFLIRGAEFFRQNHQKK